MEGSASPTCWKTVSPEEASAPKAAMKPSMANLPLTVSGALPAKAMASPKVGAFGAGGGGGGGGAALPSGAGTFGSSAARTATNLARWTRLALRPRGARAKEVVATDLVANILAWLRLWFSNSCDGGRRWATTQRDKAREALEAALLGGDDG